MGSLSLVGGSLLLAGVICFSSPAAGECSGPGYVPGLGPLSFRSQGPGQVLRLTPIPRAPEVLDVGEKEFRSVAAVSSIYARDSSYHIDMHLADVRLALGIGLGKCWDLEFAVDERAIVNAYLDDITLAVHRLFHMDDAGHDQAERNTTDVRFPKYGVYLDKGDRGPFSRSVEFTLTHLITPRTPRRPAVALSLIVRRELLEENGGTDVGTGFSFGQMSGENRIYADLTYIWFGSNKYLGIPLEKNQFAGLIAYEWRRSERFSWVAQYLYTEGVMKNLGALDQPAHEVHLGAKWRSGRFTAEAALIENIITYNNSPDFGFAFGLKAPL